MPDAHYDDPALAALYDDGNGWSIDRDFYLNLAGPAPQAILDLGCGTGLICRRYAERGHHVTGADPSAAMLDVARGARFGDRITWVQATAQSFRSPTRFDLIISTGHAFQVLETDADIAAALATIAAQLAISGRAVFESRNPALDWAARWNGNSRIVMHDGAPVRQDTKVIGRDDEYLTFEQRYIFADQTLVSRSRLRFPARARIEAAITAVGLQLQHLYGDWTEGPFDPAGSDEMVFVVRR